MELKDVTLSDWDIVEARFSAVTVSMFRLECLQVYDVDYEASDIAAFRSGTTSPPATYLSDWCKTIESNTRRGVVCERVRLITSPLTEYTKYEVAWGYATTMKAGEKVRVILQNKWPIFKTEVPILKDFWMFDNMQVFLVDYDLLPGK
jgi:hypothetical protein